MRLVKITFAFAIIGVLLGLASAVLYFFDFDFYGAIGILSTFISILLGFISIVYTFISGNETLNVLNEIKKQNKNLVDKIKSELSKDNFDEENINDVLNSISETLNN